MRGMWRLCTDQRGIASVMAIFIMVLLLVSGIFLVRMSSTEGASPRGSLALLKLARAKAAVSGRDFVVPEDVKAIAIPALAHRLTLRPELWVQRVRGEDVIAEALETVPTPPAEDVLEAAG